MRRREFIAGLGGAAALPLLVRAQQQTKPTISWLSVPSLGTSEIVEGFRRGLAEFGFSEGRNVTVEYPAAVEYLTPDRDRERLSALAADLEGRRVAAIIAPDGASALAAKAVTRDMPVIFFAGSDPVELGLVPSLNRPGRNLTGVTTFSAETVGKRLELLHKAVPAPETIALLAGRGGNPYDQAETTQAQSAAHTLGLRLLVFNITTDTEITPLFAMLVERNAGAILVGSSLVVAAKRDQILSHAARFALPTMFAFSRDARAGGLLSYSSDVKEAARQMGAYTGRILKGEKPADLPVQQATKFEFVINLKTAKALGLTIPPTLLALADEVIE